MIEILIENVVLLMIGEARKHTIITACTYCSHNRPKKNIEFVSCSPNLIHDLKIAEGPRLPPHADLARKCHQLVLYIRITTLLSFRV